ncbi:MAG TPA: hypothetical protein VIV59_14765, partial [Anaeromyxobacteraceae bacterium]
GRGPMGFFGKAVVSVALVASAAWAEEPRLKPFVLASKGAGEVEATAEALKPRLAAAGMELAGAYAPYPGAMVLVVTSPELKAAAAKTKFGAYGAIQRIGVTKVGDEVQVAFTNPVYMQYAYRMQGDLAPVRAKLEGALGKLEDFGAEGLTAKELGKYHYMWGMEYFDEPTILGRFGSHGGALKAIEQGLAKARGGARLVYEVSVPENNETVIGVSLSEDCSGDEYLMKEIDAKALRSTAHLPYEIVVSGMNAYALYARFRIAINFPDLKMMGAHSFMNIKCAPDAIEKSLKKAVWGGI